MKKKLIALTLVSALVSALLPFAVYASDPVESVAESFAEDAADEENYETGDAALDDPLCADGIGEKELLVVSFGTSYNDSRRETIGAIEKTIAAAFPDFSVRRAFTSQIIIDHIKKRDNVEIDNVKQALDRAADNGVKTLMVQPTHLMNGFEYNDLCDELAEYADAFDEITVGMPLLSEDEDFVKTAEALKDVTSAYDDGKTAICFMGHGTEADSNEIYAHMQEVFDSTEGFENYFVGTVEATPSVYDLLEEVEAGDYTRVVLRPMMVVAGDHANNDMAGDEDDSWKSIFENAGYEVVTVLEGMGQIDQIQDLYAEHAAAAISELG